MKKRVTFDFETRSAANLKLCGAYKYSLDPTTRPTCLAFKILGAPKVYFLSFDLVNRPWKKLPEELRTLWSRLILEDYEFSAHNAFFERCIYENILVARLGWPHIPFRKYRCTAAKAAACALPRNLEGAGFALQLAVQKDKRGYAAMMATCKPTKQWARWRKAVDQVRAGKTIRKRNYDLSQSPEPPLFLEYEAAPQVWETLYTYCKIDVKTEELLDEWLPDLIPIEQEIWHLNQTVNWRGLRVDVQTIQKIVAIMDGETKLKLVELDELTMGLVTKPGARASILEFLALEGVVLPDIRAKTVEDALAGGMLSPDMKALLEIRKALSKTSTKKYQALLARANENERVGDILLYHGASTGRDSGTGINPQNFPRGVIKVHKDRPYAAVENVIECDAEMLRLLYGDNLSFLFSSILRNMIIASPGFELFVADFSKIEVVVLWWLADNFDGLRIIKSGKDPYKYQAAANTGKAYDEISDEGDERQLGKAQILGAGFRMGWKRFKDSAWSMYRLKLTNKESVAAIRSYRDANQPVVELWTAYEDAAIEAVENPEKKIKAGKCVFYTKDKFLWVRLPSGRRLAYAAPSIVWKTITFTVLEEDDDGNEVEVEKTGHPKKTVQFLGLDISKRNMVTQFMHGGIWAENITQAVAREFMKQGELRLEAAGYRVLLAVHDESLAEREKGKGSLEEFTGLLCQPYDWAKDIPLEAKGWVGDRYRK